MMCKDDVQGRDHGLYGYLRTGVKVSKDDATIENNITMRISNKGAAANSLVINASLICLPTNL